MKTVINIKYLLYSTVSACRLCTSNVRACAVRHQIVAESDLLFSCIFWFPLWQRALGYPALLIISINVWTIGHWTYNISTNFTHAFFGLFDLFPIPKKKIGAANLHSHSTIKKIWSTMHFYVRTIPNDFFTERFIHIIHACTVRWRMDPKPKLFSFVYTHEWSKTRKFYTVLRRIAMSNF